jgi:hypothetical protein
MNPWIFEVDIVIVEANCNNVVAIFEVILVGCEVILILPSLNEHYYRPSSTENSR